MKAQVAPWILLVPATAVAATLTALAALPLSPTKPEETYPAQ